MVPQWFVSGNSVIHSVDELWFIIKVTVNCRNEFPGKIPVHPQSTATFVFSGKTANLREVEGAEGRGVVGAAAPDIGVVNSSGSSSSSRKSRVNPQFIVEGSLSVSLMSGRLAAKSIRKSE